ncbi:MAG: GntR family transcriptional regulator [Alphaproteobacteria bacterium]
MAKDLELVATNPATAAAPQAKAATRPARGTGARVVYETLHREILSLVLKPGAPLDETRLARRFGMSRSPIREALSRLSAQDLVMMLPNRSTLVAPLDLTTFPRYVEALDLLQRINARLAAQNRPNAIIPDLRRQADLFDASTKRQNHLEMSATNKEFHVAIATAGGNPYLTNHYSAMLDSGRRLLHLHFEYLERTGGEYVLAGEHHEMIDMIEARDVAGADRLAHAHTRQFHDRFMQFLRTNYVDDFPFEYNDQNTQVV